MNERDKVIETRAFLRGFEYGVEQLVLVYDDVLTIAMERCTGVAWAAEREDRPELRPLAIELNERLRAALADVRKLRDGGGVASLALFDVERSMQRSSS
jgi:hypothetical protein